ncbi:MAG: transposase [Mariniblastus sp.]|nr:transposase [Mariniblastus sp.]
MSQESTSMGYCSRCEQNVLHARAETGRLADWLEWPTFKLTRLLRPPVWQCGQCGHRVHFLGRCHQDADTLEMEWPVTAVQEDGNFIRRDRSLLLQKQRSARFSQKYRDGIVQRLVSGTTTMNQVSRELEVSESDLLAWVADLLERRDEMIKTLTQQVAHTPIAGEDHRQAVALTGLDDDQIVEGHVHPEDENGSPAAG